jgi:hypothetical protein
VVVVVDQVVLVLVEVEQVDIEHLFQEEQN